MYQESRIPVNPRESRVRGQSPYRSSSDTNGSGRGGRGHRNRNRRRLNPQVLLMVFTVIIVVVAVASVRHFLTVESYNNTREIAVPEWITQDFLPENEYSRPGDPLPQVNSVVVHYVGNPGTTAAQNRSYFEGLADTHETYASSHFLVDLDGSILQCIPLSEIAYCSGRRNADTIAIECCHPDDSGKFTPETEEGLRRLLEWLCETYELDREDVIRHYDVTGKECPRWYVQHPEDWEAFQDSLNLS